MSVKPVPSSAKSSPQEPKRAHAETREKSRGTGRIKPSKRGTVHTAAPKKLPEKATPSSSKQATEKSTARAHAMLTTLPAPVVALSLLANVGSGAAHFFSSALGTSNSTTDEVERESGLDGPTNTETDSIGVDLEDPEDPQVSRLKKFQEIISPEAKRSGYRLGNFFDKVVLKNDYEDIVLDKEQFNAWHNYLLGTHGQLNSELVFEYANTLLTVANRGVEMHVDDRIYEMTAENHVKAAMPTQAESDLLELAKKYANHSYSNILEGHPLPPERIHLNLPADRPSTESERPLLTGREFIALTQTTRAESKTSEEGANKLLDVLSSQGSDFLDIDTGDAPRTLSLIDLIRFAVPEYANVRFKTPYPKNSENRGNIVSIQDYIGRLTDAANPSTSQSSPPKDVHNEMKRQLLRKAAPVNTGAPFASIDSFVSGRNINADKSVIRQHIKRDKRLVEEFPRSYVAAGWLGQQKMLWLEDGQPLPPQQLSLLVDNIISLSKTKDEAAERLQNILNDVSPIIVVEPHLGSPRALLPKMAREIVFPETINKVMQTNEPRLGPHFFESRILQGYKLTSKEIRFNLPADVPSTGSQRAFLTGDEFISLAKATRAESKGDEEGAHKLLEVLSEMGSDFLDVDTGNATTRLSLVDLIRIAVPEYAGVQFKTPYSQKPERGDRPTVSTLEDYIKKGRGLREGELTFANDVMLPRLRVDNRALGSHLRRQLIP